MVYCVAFGCKYKHVKGSGISFHSFPAAGPRSNGCITANVQTSHTQHLQTNYVPNISVIRKSLQYILKPILNMDMRILRPV